VADNTPNPLVTEALNGRIERDITLADSQQVLSNRWTMLATIVAVIESIWLISTYHPGLEDILRLFFDLGIALFLLWKEQPGNDTIDDTRKIIYTAPLLGLGYSTISTSPSIRRGLAWFLIFFTLIWAPKVFKYDRDMRYRAAEIDCSNMQYTNGNYLAIAEAHDTCMANKEYTH
jgi:hypothetical protein